MEGGFGARVALFRRRKGMSQRDVARAIGRSESWMSQVERDILPVGRLSTLHALADVLDVSIYDLQPDDLEPPPESPAERAERAPVEALDGLRSVLLGHPDLAGLVGNRAEPVDPVDTAGLADAVDGAWDDARRWALTDIGARLTGLIPALESATRQSGGEGDLHLLRARAYRAAATAFAFAGEADAAWVAADRATAAAEAAGDPLGAVAGGYRLAHAFIRAGRYDQADQVLTTALDALAPVLDAAPSSAVLSLTGALHLLAAVAAAREGQRTVASDHMEAARSLAARLDHGGAHESDYETEFGPADVEAHAVAVAVELGDAGMAVDTARRVEVAALSPERQARLLVDIARAQTQRRQVGLATRALLDAEALAPELVASHPLVRDTVRQLLEQAGAKADEELGALAHRASATPP